MSGSGGSAGWTNPAIIVGILAIVSNAGWAYTSLAAPEAAHLEQRLRDNERNIAVLTAWVEHLKERRE